MKVTAVSKFERNDLKTHMRVWVQLVAEKQQQSITAHNPVDVSYWSHELTKLMSLGQQLDSGELMLIQNGVGMVRIGVDVANENGDMTIVSKSISKSEFEKNYIGEWKPDDQGFDRRKLRDAIVKAVNLSEVAATRIVTLNRGHSVKELVYMALECRGKQLCSARDQRHDSEWYANHHIAAVLHQVEEIMMESV